MKRSVVVDDFNIDALVEMAVQEMPAYPLRFAAFDVDSSGSVHSRPAVGGITYNVKVGDNAFRFAGEHIEPGVSVVFDRKDKHGKDGNAFQYLPCMGNSATLLSGAAKGAVGTVIGHHGGVEHLILDFEQSVLDRMSYDDRIMIRCKGQGLSLLSLPEIRFCNLDPACLQKWKWKWLDAGTIQIPVTKVIPAEIMGAGLGQSDPFTGDYDITTQDPYWVEKLGLEDLRFGDIVAIENSDCTFGRNYLTGACTIGVVIHGNSALSGHGPGVTTLASSKKGHIHPVIDPDANVGKILSIGTYRKKIGKRSK